MDGLASPDSAEAPAALGYCGLVVIHERTAAIDPSASAAIRPRRAGRSMSRALALDPGADAGDPAVAAPGDGAGGPPGQSAAVPLDRAGRAKKAGWRRTRRSSSTTPPGPTPTPRPRSTSTAACRRGAVADQGRRARRWIDADTSWLHSESRGAGKGNAGGYGWAGMAKRGNRASLRS